MLRDMRPMLGLPTYEFISLPQSKRYVHQGMGERVISGRGSYILQYIYGDYRESTKWLEVIIYQSADRLLMKVGIPDTTSHYVPMNWAIL